MICCKNLDKLIEKSPRSTSGDHGAAAPPLNTPFQKVNIPKKASKPPTDEPKPKQEKSNPVAEPLPKHLTFFNFPVPKDVRNTIEILESDESNVVKLESSDENEVIEGTLPLKRTITERSNSENPVYDAPTKAKKCPKRKLRSSGDYIAFEDDSLIDISSDLPDNDNPSIDFNLHRSDILASAPSEEKKRKRNKKRVTSTPANFGSAQNKSNVEQCFATPKSKAINKKQKTKSYKTDSNPSETPSSKSNTTSHINVDTSDSSVSLDKSHEETPTSRNDTQTTEVEDKKADIQGNIVMGNFTCHTESDVALGPLPAKREPGGEICPAPELAEEIDLEVSEDFKDSLRTVEVQRSQQVPLPDISGIREIDATEQFQETIDQWLNESDNDDDDLDIDIDGNLRIGDDCLIPMLSAHRDDASAPACTVDLTTFQARVLSAEDDLNDRAIREIAADDNFTFNWQKDMNSFTGRRETFTGTPGPTTPLTDQTTVLDIFYKMIDSDFIDRLCTETNKYADQKINSLRLENKLATNARLQRWTPTNRDEMISYLALTILQDLYPQVNEQAYFSFNSYGTMPYFSRIMSYNRYLLLKTLLHFVDNATLTDRTDKLVKLKPIIDYFNDKFSSLYMPAQEIAIDESLLKWHGRLGFAQKVATKAAKVGVKTYELCESFSGYLWKFFVYAGKKKQPTETIDDTTQVTDEDTRQVTGGSATEPNDLRDVTTGSATAKIVSDLIQPLLHIGHTLIMDDFYNSPLLLRYLKRNKTDCFGTLRLSREFVPRSLKTLIKSDLRQGEIVAFYCPDLSMMVWRDARLVSMISTYHRLHVGTQEKHDRVVYKPQIVLDYNKSMGGVDRKDQFLSAQPIERVRNKVWYKKVFRRLFSAAIFNCFVIYRTQNLKMTHRDFRRVLAEDLLKQHRQIDLTSEPRLTFKTSTGQVITETPPGKATRPLVDHDHFPERNGNKRYRCWMCARRKTESRTVWKCRECNIPLCIDICFRAYHKP